MKLWLLLGIMLLILPTVYAAKVVDVTLKPGESYYLEGKNITLLDSVNGSMMLCINNERFIVSKDKSISGVFIDFRRANYEEAFFKLKYTCGEDCQCDGNECSNNVCSSELEDFDNPNLSETIPDEDEVSPLPSLECFEDSGCNDGEVCTLDICSNSVCKYETIPECGNISGDQQVSKGDDKLLEYLAFSFLGVALIFGVLVILKLFLKKKKKKR